MCCTQRSYIFSFRVLKDRGRGSNRETRIELSESSAVNNYYSVTILAAELLREHRETGKKEYILQNGNVKAIEFE